MENPLWVFLLLCFLISGTRMGRELLGEAFSYKFCICGLLLTLPRFRVVFLDCVDTCMCTCFLKTPPNPLAGRCLEYKSDWRKGS